MNKININDLKGTVLLATPKIFRDPLYKGSLVYVSKHKVGHGSEGIVLNKPTKLEFHQLFRIIKTDKPIKLDKKIILNNMVLIGGPELTRNVFLLDESLDLKVLTELVMEQLISGCGPKKFEVAAGLSVWSNGQLEREIFEGDWLPVSFDRTIVFDTPYHERYHKMVEKFGLGPYFSKLSYYD